MSAFDSCGTRLHHGDTVRVILTAKAKGSSLTLQRGAILKSIRVGARFGEVEWRVGLHTYIFDACFLQKLRDDG